MTHYDSCFEYSDSRHANFCLELIKQRNDRMEITLCYLRRTGDFIIKAHYTSEHHGSQQRDAYMLHTH